MGERGGRRRCEAGAATTVGAAAAAAGVRRVRLRRRVRLWQRLVVGAGAAPASVDSAASVGGERAGRGRGRPDRGPNLAEPPWAGSEPGPVREKRDLSFFNFNYSFMYLIVIMLT